MRRYIMYLTASSTKSEVWSQRAGALVLSPASTARCVVWAASSATYVGSQLSWTQTMVSAAEIMRISIQGTSQTVDWLQSPRTVYPQTQTICIDWTRMV